jgi:hypothetical protein
MISGARVVQNDGVRTTCGMIDVSRDHVCYRIARETRGTRDRAYVVPACRYSSGSSSSVRCARLRGRFPVSRKRRVDGLRCHVSAGGLCVVTSRLTQRVGWVLMIGTIASTRRCNSSAPTAEPCTSSALEDTTMTRCSDGTTSTSCPANRARSRRAPALTCGAGRPWSCQPGRGLRAWGMPM